MPSEWIADRAVWATCL